MAEETASQRIELVEETVGVDKRQNVVGTVRARTETREETVLVDEPLRAEEVTVERVAVDRFIPEPLSVRQEGDTTIIPVMEEVVVLEKRLKLVEEIRLTKQQTIKHEPQAVTLRRQEAVVERLPVGDEDPPA